MSRAGMLAGLAVAAVAGAGAWMGCSKSHSGGGKATPTISTGSGTVYDVTDTWDYRAVNACASGSATAIGTLAIVQSTSTTITSATLRATSCSDGSSVTNNNSYLPSGTITAAATLTLAFDDYTCPGVAPLDLTATVSADAKMLGTWTRLCSGTTTSGAFSATLR